MKRVFTSVLTLALLLTLTACKDSTAPAQSIPPANDPAAVPAVTPDPAPETIPEVQDAPLRLEGDSYWVAYESEGDMRQYVPDGDDLLTDLTLWADGTARIREIEGGARLRSSTDEQNMTWTCEEDGTFCLYAPAVGDAPYWTGTVSAEGIELSRFGGTYRFRQEAMPEGGALYAPAELQGVWLQTGSEVDGYTDASLPNNFNSLIFRTDADETGKCLMAFAEAVNYGSFDSGRSYAARGLTVLDQSIYEGCGNDEWSVRIGEESPLNQHGYPTGIDLYVTLLDQNTLLQQQYYSFDNGSIPGVSYQIYKRFLPKASCDLDEASLAGHSFGLARYIDAAGVSHTEFTEPAAYTDFRLYLNTDGSYLFSAQISDGTTYTGGGACWTVGDGGTLLLRNEESNEDCYAGTATADHSTAEIFLWDNAEGIMVLKPTEGGEWDGYVDTMTDIEGRAFAAPEGTLCVLYNENYTDLSQFHILPFYEIDDGPEARCLLVTSALDDTYFWLNEDGYCREDFGTVHAGDSFVIRVNLPESGGYLLEMECSTGAYCFELNQNVMEFYQNWNYLTI